MKCLIDSYVVYFDQYYERILVTDLAYCFRPAQYLTVMIDIIRKTAERCDERIKIILSPWSEISKGPQKRKARVQFNKAYTQYLYFVKQYIFSALKRCNVPRMYHELTNTVQQSPYKWNIASLPVIAAVENSPFAGILQTITWV